MTINTPVFRALLADIEMPFHGKEREHLVALVAHIDAQMERDRKDAERYRWLRNEVSVGAVYGVSGALVELSDDKAYSVPEELDAAIDAELSKK